MPHSKAVSTGIPALDGVIDGLRLGDNVVWQVDRPDNYLKVAQPFLNRALEEGRGVVYVRFSPRREIIVERTGLVVREVDPHHGFDAFSAQVNRIIEGFGREAFYAFDNLSLLVADWATDELLANFFRVTCPCLRELDTIAYFAMTRERHSHSAVAGIRDTTQILIDLYYVKGELYIHPLKVWNRYSSQMFLPHRFVGEDLTPVFRSGDASAVSLSATKSPLRVKADSIAPWDSVYRKILQYNDDELEQLQETPEINALKQELSRMIVGSHPEYIRLSDKYLSLNNLLEVRNRLIGSGRIGGKAVGMLLARQVLLKDPGVVDFSETLEDHDSFYIGSDVFFTFLINNDLFRLRLRLTRDSQISPDEFEKVEERFLAGRFPEEIMEQFRDLIDYFGQAPIIVRSSSLLEDGFGNSFAGKYRSEFCVNQGDPETRMEAFLRAVKLVYASAVNPDALAYRRSRGLGEADEQMAILVQRVSGMRFEDYFFPPLAGVAFSHNYYRWTDRIDPKQGIIRLVFGLGTRAVNRVGADYPRLIPVSHPQLRPEIGSRIAFYSQRRIDLLDIRENSFRSLPLSEVTGKDGYPNLNLLVSSFKDGYVWDPDTHNPADSGACILTFNNLIARTDFIKIMKEALAKLEAAYGYPIDMEFTATAESGRSLRMNPVQCRPMGLPGLTEAVSTPKKVPRDLVLFRSNRAIFGGAATDMRYIVYIDPEAYARAPLELKREMGRVVGEINRHPDLARHRIMMMGPGRWGSSNIQLGVNTGYSDINHTSVLVEIAREDVGHVPDVSYGTHFFLDLVESRIIYIALYPDDPKADFNFDFFRRAPNSIGRLLDGIEKFEEYVKVIDVPAVAGKRFLQVVVGSNNGSTALCFLRAAYDSATAREP